MWKCRHPCHSWPSPHTTRRPGPRPTPAPRTEPRPEPPKPEQPPAEAPKPAEEPIRPPTILQTTPAAAEGEVERSIRASLQRASADLNRIDYRALNADARTQYDTAKRWVRQADDAIRAKNLVFAEEHCRKSRDNRGPAGRPLMMHRPSQASTSCE
jgi:hypothetical protein